MTRLKYRPRCKYATLLYEALQSPLLSPDRRAPLMPPLFWSAVPITMEHLDIFDIAIKQTAMTPRPAFVLTTAMILANITSMAPPTTAAPAHKGSLQKAWRTQAGVEGPGERHRHRGPR